jgi:hypothetical protein
VQSVKVFRECVKGGVEVFKKCFGGVRNVLWFYVKDDVGMKAIVEACQRCV